jgi:putative CocE/NonD family hydrolase
MAHGARDEFWKARDPRPAYKNATPAILTVGGWFDKEDLWGTLATYRAFDTQSPRAEVSLVMGPWGHGGWQRSEGDRLGDVTFGAKTSAFYKDTIEFPFFQRHLKGRPSSVQPEAWIFETGTNLWHAYPAWPPADAKPQTLFFHAKGRLSMSPPAVGEDAIGGDSYVSDPNRPVPYYDKPAPRIAPDYMTGDQRFAARRPDVLVYESDALADDLTLAGPLEASLSVTVSGTDADFVVKLVDVYPADVEDPEPNPTGVRKAGYQQLVRGEVMRGKFRDGFEAPKPFVPGQPTLVRFGLSDVCHTFRASHRVMVQVQSTWFPMVDRNPQTFVDIYHAKETDFVRATHTVSRTPERPSGLKVLVQRGRVP